MYFKQKQTRPQMYFMDIIFYIVSVTDLSELNL